MQRWRRGHDCACESWTMAAVRRDGAAGGASAQEGLAAPISAIWPMPRRCAPWKLRSSAWRGGFAGACCGAWRPTARGGASTCAAPSAPASLAAARRSIWCGCGGAAPAAADPDPGREPLDEPYNYFFCFRARPAGAFRDAECFAFHTRLVRVSDALRERDSLRMREKLSLISLGWPEARASANACSASMRSTPGTGSAPCHRGGGERRTGYRSAQLLGDALARSAAARGAWCAQPARRPAGLCAGSRPACRRRCRTSIASHRRITWTVWRHWKPYSLSEARRKRRSRQLRPGREHR